MENLSAKENLTNQQIKEKIKQRRRQLLVHSYLYYELDNSIIEDWKFDSFSNDLVDLQEKYPELSKEVDYYEEFKDFDGSSGYDLKYNQDWVINTAFTLLRYHEQNKRNGCNKKCPLSIVNPDDSLLEIPL